MPYREGDRVGEYEVQRRLGRGAYGEVFQVRVLGQSGRTYALKVLPCDCPGPDGTADREAAFAEAQLLQRLRHPHIVSCETVVWDAAREEVRLLLECMDGGDLRALIEEHGGPGHRGDQADAVSEKRHFEAHFARRVLGAVGGALAYVHAAGVIHRDVKPANVLLSRQSQRIKLADFGTARLLEATNHARTVVGTPYYFSPEIVANKAYCAASDAWALGVCLYEVAALERPFNANNHLALVVKINGGEYAALPPHVAHDVCRSIEGLLVKDQEQRWSLADALRASDAIAALVTGFSPDGTALPKEAAEEVEEVALDSHSSDLSSASSWRGSTAAAAAREALGNDVDDPEELVHALVAVERECAARAPSRSGCAEDTGPAADSAGSAALDALESELRLRIAALRVDAAAMLNDLQGSRGEADLHEPNPIPLCRQLSAEEALEVATALEAATTLGVDTEPSEERIARKKGMLSLRIVWGGVARFCMLPVNVGFESLIAEVSRRFGLAHIGALPQLSWCEVGETFKLNNQASWEECLQRRGLVARPGRLELCVDSDDQPPLPVQLRATRRLPEKVLCRRPELFTWRTGDRMPASLSHTARRGAQPAGRPLGPSPTGSCAAASRTAHTAGSTIRLTAGRSLSRFCDATQAADADESRRRLHDAAIKVQSLFRGRRVRRSALEADVATPCRGASKHRGSTVPQRCVSRGSGGQQPALQQGWGTAQSFHTRRSGQVRCRIGVSAEGREERPQAVAASSPQGQVSSHSKALQTLVPAAAGGASLLQVNGRAAPRR